MLHLFKRIVKLLNINMERSLRTVPVIFGCYMTSLCSVMSHDVLFAYRIMLNILIGNRVAKIPPKKLYCKFKFSLHAMQSGSYWTKCRVIGIVSKLTLFILQFMSGSFHTEIRDQTPLDHDNQIQESHSYLVSGATGGQH